MLTEHIFRVSRHLCSLSGASAALLQELYKGVREGLGGKRGEMRGSARGADKEAAGMRSSKQSLQLFLSAIFFPCPNKNIAKKEESLHALVCGGIARGEKWKIKIK